MRDIPDVQVLYDIITKRETSPMIGDYRGIIGMRYGPAFGECIYFHDCLHDNIDVYDGTRWLRLHDNATVFPPLTEYYEVMTNAFNYLDSLEG